jgi:hypothetical protein
MLANVCSTAGSYCSATAKVRWEEVADEGGEAEDGLELAQISAI